MSARDERGSLMDTSTAPTGPRKERFTALFRAEYGYVWGTLRRFGVNERDVEDVAHDIFLRVYDKLDDYDPARPAKPWLFSFAYRAANDYRKLSRHRVEVMAEREAPSSAPTAEQALERIDEARLVTDALASLDFDRRAVLVAFELDDIPMKVIAETTGVPLFTAYSRLRLAREDFRSAVERLTKKPRSRS